MRCAAAEAAEGELGGGGEQGRLRYGRDMREMWARYGGDMGYGRDSGEIWARLVAEVLEYREERKAHRHLVGAGVAARLRGSG